MPGAVFKIEIRALLLSTSAYFWRILYWRKRRIIRRFLEYIILASIALTVRTGNMQEKYGRQKNCVKNDVWVLLIYARLVHGVG